MRYGPSSPLSVFSYTVSPISNLEAFLIVIQKFSRSSRKTYHVCSVEKAFIGMGHYRRTSGVRGSGVGYCAL